MDIVQQTYNKFTIIVGISSLSLCDKRNMMMLHSIVRWNRLNSNYAGSDGMLEKSSSNWFQKCPQKFKFICIEFTNWKVYWVLNVCCHSIVYKPSIIGNNKLKKFSLNMLDGISQYALHSPIPRRQKSNRPYRKPQQTLLQCDAIPFHTTPMSVCELNRQIFEPEMSTHPYTRIAYMLLLMLVKVHKVPLLNTSLMETTLD